jgi:hypothetical protein
LNISEAVKEGKVQTIIIPSNMTSLMLNKWWTSDWNSWCWRMVFTRTYPKSANIGWNL